LQKAPRNFWIAVLFLICSAWFVSRGPYRAIRYSTTGDFSTVYAAARCWIHGSNPYDRGAVKTELVNAGAPSDIQHDQDVNPSVYLPSAFPFVAPLAWLGWIPANILWCLLSLLVLGWSLIEILKITNLTPGSKWLAACAVLLFSPVYVGIYDGNPSVLVISLVMIAISKAAEERLLASGFLLGITLCFKPQIAVCALCVLVVWKCTKPILIGGAVFAGAMLIGIFVVSHFGHNWEWQQTEQQNVAVSFRPGGQSDPRPESHVAWQLLNAQTLASYVVRDRRACDAAVWLTGGLLTALWFARKGAGEETRWRAAGFFAALTLIVTYHRYYDAQLLILLIPALIQFWKNRQHVAAACIGAGLLVLAFPVQSIFAKRLAAAALSASLAQFALLRNQPVAVLEIAVTLALCCVAQPEARPNVPEEGETGTGVPAAF